MNITRRQLLDASGITLIAGGAGGTWWWIDRTRGRSEEDDRLRNEAQSIEDDWGDAVAEEDREHHGDYEPGETIGVLHIPAWGEDHAVPIVEGVEDDHLLLGVGRYPTTVLPGEQGNMALAGHRSGDPQPFRDLPDLVPGDALHVSTPTHDHHYEVRTRAMDTNVLADESWVLYEPTIDDYQNKATITLTTCEALVLNEGRYVLFGELVKSEEKAETK